VSETRSPNLHFGAKADGIKTGPVWTDEDGETHGALKFDVYCDIVFHDPEQPREAAAVLLTLANAMEAEAARAAAEKGEPDGT
jgi:hypothetical protein